MMDLRELYQEIILDHNKNPRHHHAMPEATHLARGFNRMCGDKLTVYLNLHDEHISAISFEGSGCAISQASASLMTEVMLHKSLPEAHRLFEAFHQMLTHEEHLPQAGLEKLAVLAGVRAYPARVKCATLAWHTFEAALKQTPTTVATE